MSNSKNKTARLLRAFTFAVGTMVLPFHDVSADFVINASPSFGTEESKPYSHPPNKPIRNILTEDHIMQMFYNEPKTYGAWKDGFRAEMTGGTKGSVHHQLIQDSLNNDTYYRNSLRTFPDFGGLINLGGVARERLKIASEGFKAEMDDKWRREMLKNYEETRTLARKIADRMHNGEASKDFKGLVEATRAHYDDVPYFSDSLEAVKQGHPDIAGAYRRLGLDEEQIRRIQSENITVEEFRNIVNSNTINNSTTVNKNYANSEIKIIVNMIMLPPPLTEQERNALDRQTELDIHKAQMEDLYSYLNGIGSLASLMDPGAARDIVNFGRAGLQLYDSMAFMKNSDEITVASMSNYVAAAITFMNLLKPSKQKSPDQILGEMIEQVLENQQKIFAGLARTEKGVKYLTEVSHHLITLANVNFKKIDQSFDTAYKRLISIQSQLANNKEYTKGVAQRDRISGFVDQVRTLTGKFHNFEGDDEWIELMTALSDPDNATPEAQKHFSKIKDELNRLGSFITTDLEDSDNITFNEHSQLLVLDLAGLKSSLRSGADQRTAMLPSMGTWLNAFRGMAEDELRNVIEEELRSAMESKLHDVNTSELLDIIKKEFSSITKYAIHSITERHLQSAIRREFGGMIEGEFRNVVENELRGIIKSDLRLELDGELHAVTKSELRSIIDIELGDVPEKRLRDVIRGVIVRVINEDLNDLQNTNGLSAVMTTPLSKIPNPHLFSKMVSQYFYMAAHRPVTPHIVDKNIRLICEDKSRIETANAEMRKNLPVAIDVFNQTLNGLIQEYRRQTPSAQSSYLKRVQREQIAARDKAYNTTKKNLNEGEFITYPQLPEILDPSFALSYLDTETGEHSPLHNKTFGELKTLISSYTDEQIFFLGVDVLGLFSKGQETIKWDEPNGKRQPGNFAQTPGGSNDFDSWEKTSYFIEITNPAFKSKYPIPNRYTYSVEGNEKTYTGRLLQFTEKTFHGADERDSKPHREAYEHALAKEYYDRHQQLAQNWKLHLNKSDGDIKRILEEIYRAGLVLDTFLEGGYSEAMQNSLEAQALFDLKKDLHIMVFSTIEKSMRQDLTDVPNALTWLDNLVENNIQEFIQKYSVLDAENGRDRVLQAQDALDDKKYIGLGNMKSVQNSLLTVQNIFRQELSPNCK